MRTKQDALYQKNKNKPPVKTDGFRNKPAPPSGGGRV